MAPVFKNGKKVFELTDVLEETKSQNDREVIVIDGRDYEKKNAEPTRPTNGNVPPFPSKEEIISEVKMTTEKLVLEIMPEIIERTVKELIPDIAEKIIKEEIEKLKKISAEKQ